MSKDLENVANVAKEVTALEALEKQFIIDDISEDSIVKCGDFKKTNLFMTRRSFESRKDSSRMLYGYSVHAEITRTSATRGTVTRDFDIDCTPVFPKDTDGKPVTDIDIYKYLDLLFLESDEMPLYVQEINYKDSAGEMKKSIRYSVVDFSTYGELSVAFKPRGDGGKAVLKLLTGPFLA